MGEVTRPSKAAMLSTFEHTYLDPLEEAINAQDWDAFEARFQAAVNGCNACQRPSLHRVRAPGEPGLNLKTSPRTGVEEDEEEE